MGVSLGYEESQIANSVWLLKQTETKFVETEIGVVQDGEGSIEDREAISDEEIDKLILNSLCGNLMDEVMDEGVDSSWRDQIPCHPRTSSKNKRGKGSRKKTAKPKKKQ
jgi:hypothetical protein